MVDSVSAGSVVSNQLQSGTSLAQTARNTEQEAATAASRAQDDSNNRADYDTEDDRQSQDTSDRTSGSGRGGVVDVYA